MSEDELPIPGMKVVPAYVRGDPIMSGAFVACVTFCGGNKEILEQFEKDSGGAMANFFNRSPLERMVDKATGYEKTRFIEFCDWEGIEV